MAAEQTFNSPGYFDSETLLGPGPAAPTGVPAGVVGASMMGPAFVPVTVGSFDDFTKTFGTVDPNMPAPYAVSEFLRNRSALTFVRVLGAGGNTTTSDILTTQQFGTVSGAGFIVKGSSASSNDLRKKGCVQFITAKHFVSSTAAIGYPEFQNDSFGLASSYARLVRGMVFLASGTRLQVLDHDQAYSNSNTTDDAATIGFSTGTPTFECFKLVISSSATGFSTADGSAGVRVLTASLDPQSDNYIAKILNTDPARFQQDEHLLYAHFPVEKEVASVSTDSGAVVLASGSATSNGFSGVTFNDLFGRFDTRYSTPRTTPFISQPFGNTEYDLFSFETLSDGANASSRFKITISNVARSSDPNNPYGTFTVLVRDFMDSDQDMSILEQFGPCDLNPASEFFIAKVIGDSKTFYNFDAESTSDRRLITMGRYANSSAYIRVVLSTDLLRGAVPTAALPFGFRGLPVVKTNDTLTDGTTAISNIAGGSPLRLATVATGDGANAIRSILPPVPFRFKVTKGSVNTSGGFVGQPGQYELADPRLTWGVKFERLQSEDVLTNAIFYSNASASPNEIVENYSKLLGIAKLDTLVTGSGADQFNNNKFTLARVALSMNLIGTNVATTVDTYLTGTADDLMREAAYIRNGVPNVSNYTIADSGNSRLTFASLASLTSSIYFNKLSGYAKFTNMFYGGFDGTNILDKDMSYLNDRATSSETGGKAVASLNIGLDSSFSPGVGTRNAYVQAYRVGASTILDSQNSSVNIIATPGIRDPFVTDYTSQATQEYSKAIYLMDIPAYDDSGNRLFSYASARPDTDKTVTAFARRNYNNSYAATYFPDVSITDPVTGQPVVVGASVAALSALGFNDSVSFPWFAPAGFNRGALERVVNVATRLNTADRDNLYINRINPIASFPNAGFVIFGQKTLQQARTALDRVNVRRLLLEVKRIVSNAALGLVFEQNTPATRAKFVSLVNPQLALIQTQQGVDQFRVICDGTNNSQEDINQNRLNGKIIIAPTRAVEFIAINFVIDQYGVTFA